MIQTGFPNNEQDVAPCDTPRRNNMCTEVYERDPKYFYPDGGVVFSAEGVLFRVPYLHRININVKLTGRLCMSKLQASLILPPESFLPTSGNEVRRYPLNADLPTRLTDSCVDNPIVLNVTANQFRTYLFAVLGRPSDKGYLAFLTDAQSKEKHSHDLLIRYLDIADLSWQFGMTELEVWAVSQIELILESAYSLAKGTWRAETLMRLSSRSLYHNDRPIRSSTLSFIEYFISIWTVPIDRHHDEEVASSNLNTCVELYQNPSLRRKDPTLFGCAFAAILSLGHRSVTWTSKVTREERATLYAAQVQLVSLSRELESVGWIHRAENHPPGHAVCGNCSNGLREAWTPSFGNCEQLNFSVPLKDVTSVARLPQYRMMFWAKWNSLISRRQQASASGENAHIHCEASWDYAPASASGWFFAGLVSSPTSRAACNVGRPLVYIDGCIQRVYLELAERYGRFAKGD